MDPALDIEPIRERCGQAQLYIYLLRNNARTPLALIRRPRRAACDSCIIAIMQRDGGGRAAINIGPRAAIRFHSADRVTMAGGSKIDRRRRLIFPSPRTEL